MTKFVISIKKNLKGIILIIFASFLTSVGQLLWKMSSENISFLFVGFILYGIGAILMILALRYGSLSVIHPLMSFGYIFAIFLGSTILKETITLNHLMAITIIIIGVTLIGGNDV